MTYTGRRLGGARRRPTATAAGGAEDDGDGRWRGLGGTGDGDGGGAAWQRRSSLRLRRAGGNWRWKSENFLSAGLYSKGFGPGSTHKPEPMTTLYSRLVAPTGTKGLFSPAQRAGSRGLWSRLVAPTGTSVNSCFYTIN